MTQSDRRTDKFVGLTVNRAKGAAARRSLSSRSWNEMRKRRVSLGSRYHLRQRRTATASRNRRWLRYRCDNKRLIKQHCIMNAAKHTIIPRTREGFSTYILMLKKTAVDIEENDMK